MLESVATAEVAVICLFPNKNDDGDVEVPPVPRFPQAAAAPAGNVDNDRGRRNDGAADEKENAG